MAYIDVVMPFLSETMEEGTILAWMVGVGDVVAVGTELAEIETDKITMVYESDVSGRIVEIVVTDGQTARCGEAIARLDVDQA